MNIENMTLFDWLMIVGLGIMGGMINFLVTSFIKWISDEELKDWEKVEEDND